MIRRSTAIKTNKTSKNVLANSSRVGIEYQVNVSDFVYNTSTTFCTEPSKIEINTWNPSYCTINKDFEEYMKTANFYNYSEENARIFLHYHKYDYSRALIDLPNYEPILNRWNKHDTQKFLKCVDSKPRKNFVNVKKSFPAYQMGEIAALYYGIAAPFKAISRHDKKHAQFLQSCFEKSVKRGFIEPYNNRRLTVLTTNAALSNHINSPLTSTAEQVDNLEKELEEHLKDMLGESKTKRLLNGVKRGRPPSVLLKQNLMRGDKRSKWLPHQNNGSNGSDVQQNCSDQSSVLDGERSNKSHSGKFFLPSGIHYNHEEFLKFMVTPLVEIEETRNVELEKIKPLDDQLQTNLRKTEFQSQQILDGLEKFIPAGGFPKLSYRWTKIELALLLTAFSKLGDDFSEISKTLGTKSESLLRDFYSQFRQQLDLDAIIGHTTKSEQPSLKTETNINQKTNIISDAMKAESSNENDKLTRLVSEPTVVNGYQIKLSKSEAIYESEVKSGPEQMITEPPIIRPKGKRGRPRKYPMPTDAKWFKECPNSSIATSIFTEKGVIRGRGRRGRPPLHR